MERKKQETHTYIYIDTHTHTRSHIQAFGLQAITQTVGIVARGKPDTRLFAFRFRRRRSLAVGRKIKKKILQPSIYTEILYVCERIYSVYIT